MPRNYRRIFLDNSLAVLSGGQCVEISECIEGNIEEVVEQCPKIIQLDWVIFDVNNAVPL